MPNWCHNELSVSGDKKTLAKFMKQAESKKARISLGKFVPMPKELMSICVGGNNIDGKQVKAWREVNGKSVAVTEAEQAKLIKKYGTASWYDWAIANWGTKWDVDGELLNGSPEDEYVEYMFDSAWSPPVSWLEKVAKMYPTLRFSMKYEEEGMGFLGRAKAEHGVVVDKCID